MHHFFVLIALLFAAVPAVADWRVVRGPWFTAEIPADFTVEKLAEARAADGPMTLRFHAPDGSAAFVLHAPLWAVAPAFAEGADGEVLIGRRTVKTTGGETTWLTWRDPESGAQRSYRIVREEGGALTGYGFEYDDEEALRKWRPAYLRFLSSVKRFAD